MKKKFIKGLALTMAMSTLLCNTAFATPIDLRDSVLDVQYDSLNQDQGTTYYTDENNEWANGTINEEVRVRVDLASKFTITIPKEIVLDGETGKADYVVNAKGDIAGDQVLKVVPDPDFVLSEKGGKDDQTATVVQEQTDYTYVELQGEGTDYPGSIEATLTAGEWAGRFNFNIKFEDGQASEGEEDNTEFETFNYNRYAVRYTCDGSDGEKYKEFLYFEDLKEFTRSSILEETISIETIQNSIQEPEINLDASGMFECQLLKEIDMSNFNTDNIINMSGMFSGCTSLEKLDISNFNTSDVTDMSEMFNFCSSLTQLNIESFDTSNVISMGNMFSNCSSLTELELDHFNTFNVVEMNGMFAGCSKIIELDLSNFNTFNIYDMDSMFINCTLLKTIYISDLWNIENAIYSMNMFSNCINLIGKISYDSSVVDKTHANYQTGYLTYKEASN